MAPIELQAAVYYNASSLLSDDAGVRLGTATPLGLARFLPRRDEIFTAIFATWNTLDAIMWARSRIQKNSTNAAGDAVMEFTVGGKHTWQTGYLSEVQVR